MHKTRYQQLQPEDRVSIASLRQQGFGVRANRAGDRPLGEHGESGAAAQYRVQQAVWLEAGAATGADSSRGRQAVAELYREGRLWLVVKTCLSWNWSPSRSHAGAHVARRTRHAGLARDDLHLDLRARQRRVAQAAHQLPAPEQEHAQAALRRAGPARADRRDAQHPHAPARGGGPRDARALGRRSRRPGCEKCPQERGQRITGIRHSA